MLVALARLELLRRGRVARVAEPELDLEVAIGEH